MACIIVSTLPKLSTEIDHGQLTDTTANIRTKIIFPCDRQNTHVNKDTSRDEKHRLLYSGKARKTEFFNITWIIDFLSI